MCVHVSASVHARVHVCVCELFVCCVCSMCM